MKPHLQCAEQQVSRSNLTKYCACHAERLAYLVLITYETSFTMRGATGVTIQPHQILRLSRRKTHLLNHHYIWNLIYNARSNRCHDPTSPNTAPATQNDSHAWSSSHMKRHLQCAEQQVSPSNLTKYCACHTEWLACLIVLTYETSFTMRGATGVTIQPHQILRLPHRMTRMLDRPSHMKRHLQCAEQQVSPSNLTKYCACHEKWHCKISMKISKNRWNVISNAGADPTMIREWSEHENANRNPPRKWGYFARSPEAFSIVKYNVLHPILHSNFHQILRLPRKVPLDLHQVLHLPRKVALELHQVLHLPPKVTLELHQLLRLPRKVTLELHQVLRLPRKMTRLLYRPHIWKRHFQCAEQQVSLSNLPKYCTCPRKMTLQDVKENLQKQVKRHFHCGADPTMIREWSDHDPSMKTQTATRLASEVTFRAHHEHFLLKNTTFRAQSYIQTFTKYCACHEKCHLNFTKYCACHEKWHLNFTKYCACHEKWHLNFTKYCACHEKWHLNFTKYCTCHEKWHLNFTKYCACHCTVTEPYCTPTLLDSTLNWTLLYSTLLDTTLLDTTLLGSTLLASILLDSTLLDLLYLILLYLTLVYLTYSTWLYSTWLYSTWHYSTWLYSTWHYSTWLYSTWHYSIWLYSTWLYSTWPTLLDSTLLDTILLDSTLLDSTLLDSTLLDSTLLDSTLLDSTLLDLTLLRCRSYIGSFST